MRRVKISIIQGVETDNNAAIGIGSLIIFIAMILVAGIAAAVFIQTMNSLEQQALQTGQEVMKDISSGLKVSYISGYNNNSLIDQLAIIIRTTAGSDDINLNYTFVSLSNSSKQVILNYSSSVFSDNVSNGLFETLNSSLLTSTSYGIMIIRDIDNSCTVNYPVINSDDMIVLLVNTTECFSGINPRTKITGNIVPENGISGVISFTTPSVYIEKIIELQ